MGPSAIAIIFNERDEVLLLKRMQPQRDFPGYWGFPGGALDGLEEYNIRAVFGHCTAKSPVIESEVPYTNIPQPRDRIAQLR